MANHEQVTLEDERSLTEGWRGEVIIPKKYNAHRDKFLQLLFVFEVMWDGYLDHIKTERHRIVLTYDNTRPVHSASTLQA